MNQCGTHMEELAYQYLIARGYQARARNFHCKFGEIDLIMESPHHEIVFVEVRYRKSNQFGSATASITASKQRKIAQTAIYYLQCHQLNDEPCRFDVIAVSGNQDKPTLQWITDAFQV